MAKLHLRGKDLIGLGFPEGKAIGLAISALMKHNKKATKAEALATLQQMLADPDAHAADPVLGPAAIALAKQLYEASRPVPQLLPQPLVYTIYGRENIEKGAFEQMQTAMRLPVAVAGALMPDAHQGYGLPIGGVLATRNAVIPYGVGMDIGCRMCLTLYDLPPELIDQDRKKMQALLLENTRFGYEVFADPFDDPVLERPEFKEIPKVKELRQKAREQIGTSGSGNHFVEFGIVEWLEVNEAIQLPKGKYLAILSHSGSRGLGASIAQYYTKVAMQQNPLPPEAKHLAWLDLDSEAGQEYWLAMNLAGDYASACHHHIHRRLAHALGAAPIVQIENHHNFAWREKLLSGEEVIVHRKGATPAAEGDLGIIPGSMASPGYIVRGRGQAASLHSASHGAGRQLSRRKAKEQFNINELRKYLKEHHVDLIGGGLDESPFAYKDINAVMAHQSELVDVLGRFTPRVVRMDKE